jgi:hypothetical protein
MNKPILLELFLKPGLIVMFSLLVYGCSKPHIIEDHSYGPLIKVNNEAKSYITPFKVGSYWIFEDESTKQTDSVYVANYYDGGQAEGSGEAIQTYITSNITGTLVLSVFADQDTSDSEILIVYDNPEGSIQITVSNTLYSPFDHSIPLPSVSLLDSFSTFSSVYKNVLYTKDNGTGNTFYFVKGIGLIGRDMKIGNHLAQYRLLRYKL